jgi:hypothetical protein
MMFNFSKFVYIDFGAEALLLEGELMDNKNERFKGKIKIMNDNPPVEDYRLQESQGSIVGGLLSAMKTENSSVYIEVEGVKKPIRRKIDDILHIKTTDGKTYVTGVVGNALDANSRYSLLEEVKSSKKLSLYNEFFPQDVYVLKKPTDDKFYELPIISIKKSLKKYFESCPKMHSKIDAGDFNSDTKENYLRIFDTFSELCGK